ncbi:unnamed protein product [Echinostoma caproni]|uniref:Delta-like protein n=1 Tax=Echinostoma caproni TaxID=27848 RepID=A0A183A5B8_9TREM|nr:unnamed protein product [Echinostoma caproni]
MNPTDQWVEHQRELTSATESSHTTANYVNQSTSDAVPHLVLRVRLECEQYFYGLDCGQFCQPMRGPHGNFICDPETGTQQCLPGWTGERCTQGGSCEVQPDSGQLICHCPPGFTGIQCDEIMSGNITDEYPSPDLEEQTSNQTQPIPLNSLTFLSNVYRSSLMLFLLTFVLLLCVAILAHCIRSYHHHQTKPRYVHQSQLTYPHIANNLSAEIVRNPMHANYEEKALHSLDWTRSERAQTVTVFSSKCTPNLDKVLLIQNVFKSKYPPLPESYPTSDNMFNGFATRSGCRAQSKPQLTGWFSGQIRPFTIRLSLPSQPDRSSSV